MVSASAFPSRGSWIRLQHSLLEVSDNSKNEQTQINDIARGKLPLYNLVFFVLRTHWEESDLAFCSQQASSLHSSNQQAKEDENNVMVATHIFCSILVWALEWDCMGWNPGLLAFILFIVRVTYITFFVRCCPSVYFERNIGEIQKLLLHSYHLPRIPNFYFWKT